jgi:hypothetical protein
VLGGTVPLFGDPRIARADNNLRELSGQGFSGQTVHELGPLEAGHTYALAPQGAKEFTAVGGLLARLHEVPSRQGSARSSALPRPAE